MKLNRLDSEKRGIIAALLPIIGFIGLSYFFIQTPTPAPIPPPNAPMNTDVTLPPNTLTIPTLGIQAPVIYTIGMTESDFQEALQDGVVHYPGTADIGAQGNAYFFGHSSDFTWSKGDYKTVFAHLPEIQIGTDIYIADPIGGTFHYIVRETRIIESDDRSVLAQGLESLLTLQTSYPVGTAKKRFVAIAQLQSLQNE